MYSDNEVTNIISRKNNINFVQIANSVNQTISGTGPTEILFGISSVPSNNPALKINIGSNSISILEKGYYKINLNIALSQSVVGQYTMSILNGVTAIHNTCNYASAATNLTFNTQMIYYVSSTASISVNLTQPAGTSTILSSSGSIATLSIEKLQL